MKTKDPIISLTGGLGNQLFQLAASLYFYDSNGFSLEWGIGKPRLNEKRTPELSSFELPPQIRFLEGRRRIVWLMSKSTGYQLRMGISPRFYEKNFLAKNFITFVGNIISHVYFFEKRVTFVSQTLGYTEKRPKQDSVFVIGYFQSYKWLLNPRVFKSMHEMKPLDMGRELEFYKQLSKEENPLVVHVRLGDYKGSQDFGILDPQYFVQQTREMMGTNQYGKIWVFSDEIELAKEYFSDFSPNTIRFVGTVDDSTANTFEAMRFGAGYVISNSTFSWWAASLSYRVNPSIVAPAPWFKGMDEPYELIPPKWARANALWG